MKRKSAVHFSATRCRRLKTGKPEGYVAAIVLGGAMGVNDADEMDFIADELAWVGGLLENGALLLGICLGAQMIAHAKSAQKCGSTRTARANASAIMT